MALAFTAGFNLANMGAVASRIGDAYGIGLGVVGLFTTALFVTHASLQVPMGRLCDRLGPRIVGAAGLLVVAAASTAALGWRETWFAIGMRMLAGVGTAAAFVGGGDYVRATIGSPVALGVFGAVSMGSGGLALARRPAVAGVACAVRCRCSCRGSRSRARCDRAARGEVAGPCARADGPRPATAAARSHARGVVRPVGRARQLDRDAARAERWRVRAPRGPDRRARALRRCRLAPARRATRRPPRRSWPRASSQAALQSACSPSPSPCH